MDAVHTYAVIMAGGGGTRLWPISRKEMPKQLLPLLGKDTLFQSTVARLEKLFPPERILVVTVAEQAREMENQVPSIPVENYLIEPAPRGTASVVGLAAEVLLPDMNGNVAANAQHLAVDTNNTLIYAKNGDRLVVTIGLDDIVVVDADDVLMVCKVDQ